MKGQRKEAGTFENKGKVAHERATAWAVNTVGYHYTTEKEKGRDEKKYQFRAKAKTAVKQPDRVNFVEGRKRGPGLGIRRPRKPAPILVRPCEGKGKRRPSRGDWVYFAPWGGTKREKKGPYWASLR